MVKFILELEQIHFVNYIVPFVILSIYFYQGQVRTINVGLQYHVACK